MKALQKILKDTAKTVAETHEVSVCTGTITVEIFDIYAEDTVLSLAGAEAAAFIAGANALFNAARVPWDIACHANAKRYVDCL
tara:strand:+ start:607 stop:855 length:249 start_codon:yes stop_codon:yes gene_type:complete